MPELFDILRWFLAARALDRETDRARLEKHQDRLLERLRRDVLPRSPFYASRSEPADWPVMDKATWMHAFDRINTAGITLEEARRVAEAAERTRNFQPLLRGYTIGLSTGTSGQRGVFMLSAAERRRWAGVILAKLMPPKPWRRRRVAFWLRANSTLYESSSRSRFVEFHYFDLLKPLESFLPTVQALQPHVLIAPPSVLRLLAELQLEGGLVLSPEKVISVAEVLHEDDRVWIERAFRVPLAEVYQATEGLLATTCERGTLHLNEAFVKFDFEWLDRESGRFIPIITDLTRATQPVVRFRLDDVLQIAREPCSCGRAARTIASIQGRSDEICSFVDWHGKATRVFPDFIARAILGADPLVRDFRALQLAPGVFRISLLLAEGTSCDSVGLRVREAFARLAATLDSREPRIEFAPYVPEPGAKRRRVRIAATTPGSGIDYG